MHLLLLLLLLLCSCGTNCLLPSTSTGEKLRPPEGRNPVLVYRHLEKKLSLVYWQLLRPRMMVPS